MFQCGAFRNRYFAQRPLTTTISGSPNTRNLYKNYISELSARNLVTVADGAANWLLTRIATIPRNDTSIGDQTPRYLNAKKSPLKEGFVIYN